MDGSFGWLRRYVQGGNINASDASLASTGQETSKSKVT